MKLHKIRNVNLEECSKEQKIAANLAWCAHSWYSCYRELTVEFQKSNAIADIRDDMIKHFKEHYSIKGLDMDAVFVALNQGLKTYMDRPSAKIYADYAEIGRDFPIPY